jgi:hypothetical protein
MTNKANKENHREIIDGFHVPENPNAKEDTAEIVYGDANNPSEKFHTGSDIDLKEKG